MDQTLAPAPLPRDQAARQQADDRIVANLTLCAHGGRQAQARRLQALDHEWDTDRAVELHAAVAGGVGLVLGQLAARAWFGLTAAVGVSLFLHATRRWYPVLPLLRRLGVRDSREIARERWALKALRGDFAGLATHNGQAVARASSEDAAPSPEAATERLEQSDRSGRSRLLPATATRVEHSTDARINQAIRERTDDWVLRLAHGGRAALDARIARLDREWDIERALQLNASIVLTTGLLLGLRVDRRFLLLPAAALAFLAQHALQGWCPPIPLLRGVGRRTEREIARERYAMKALRGDFDTLSQLDAESAGARARAVLKAVDA